jgi:hypothetical protein
MKTKFDDETGKWSFDYEPDGILYLPSERVAILQRGTGRVEKVTTEDLYEQIPESQIGKVRSHMMHFNLHTTPKYQIMGLADEEERL